MGKSQIIKRIHNAAKNYKQHFVGNTFMFVYEGRYVEVIFKKNCFLHLTGVNTNLRADDFYKHSLVPKQLRPQEVFFDAKHPYDLADKKTSYLADLYKITITDVVIADNIATMTFTYGIGITNLEFVICLGDDTDLAGNLISSCKVPYSFRVEEIDNAKFSNLYEVTHVFKKKTGERKYSELTFGNEDTIKMLPQDIRDVLDIS